MKRVLASVVTAGVISAALVVTSTGTQAAAPSAGQAQSRTAAIASARTNAVAHAGLARGQGAVLRDAVLDKWGSNVRFARTYHGFEVIGRDFVIHQTESGAWKSTSGRAVRPFQLPTKALVGRDHAATLASRALSYRNSALASRKVILPTRSGMKLAWEITVSGRAADHSPRADYVFVDARTGRVLTHWAAEVNVSGTGNGLTVGQVSLDTTQSGSAYQMVDPVRGNGETHNGPYSSNAPIYTDADNLWGTGSNSDPATAGVDADYGIAKTWDFYKSTFGRNGIANDGQGARSYVHDGAYVNASWSDSCFCMKYGDGDGTTYMPLVAIDVAGHEMSHGVTSRTANLQYRGESGGLNEANSDIFGTMVEWYANNANDVPDYVIGEEIYYQYNPATNYIRRMDKPSMDGASQDCWNRRTKSVDVHYSSGPANHWFYLASEGSGAKSVNGIAYNSPTCNGAAVAAIGRDVAARIWYRALTVYMTSTTTYAGARTATISAATDLYGATSTQVAGVKALWSAVGVN